MDTKINCVMGWEFLEKYKNLTEEKKSQTLLLMLSTSSHPDDLARADREVIVKDYIFKPLTEEILQEVIAKYFGKLIEKLPYSFN